MIASGGNLIFRSLTEHTSYKKVSHIWTNTYIKTINWDYTGRKLGVIIIIEVK
ncbi:protein of unknown function [[Clostridium] ultunense Esp]|uniref:Uncharacterized protein n=1 Tax=[Clostridium] ultunense Esp TaxID=1288971 RepID=A0A1M4PKJ9_9FIRM|nr:protein of unknown function [[Clostridium] ultunense Esp]